MWGLLIQRRGNSARVDLFVLALLEQLHLATQHQYLLLLRGQRLVELPHCILLVGQLGLHIDQLLLQLLDSPQAWFSRRRRCFRWLFSLGQRDNILPTWQKDTAQS